MENYKQILSRVGWMLVVIGILDIGLMIYCIVYEINYSSSFNIFAVIGGVFLIKGNLKAARLISQFMAFLIGGMAAITVLFPMFTPLDLQITGLKLHPLSIIQSVLFAIVFLMVLLWSYKKLTSDNVLEAMKEKGIGYNSFWKRPNTGFIVGGCLGIILGGLLWYLMGGPMAGQAEIRAQKQYGFNYKYHMKSFNVNYGNGIKSINAIMTAYNDNEIKQVRVEWKE